MIGVFNEPQRLKLSKGNNMNTYTKNILYMLGGAVAVIAIFMLVNFRSMSSAFSQSSAFIPSQFTNSEHKRICDALQKKVDAEGQPGWDGLSEELKSEIKATRAAKIFCIILGDSKKF